MVEKKTKTREKPKFKVNLEDFETQENLEINIRRDDESLESVSQTSQLEGSSHPGRKWWFIEIWEERREVFKNLASHIIFTLVLVVFLILVHSIIEGSTMSKDEKELLKKIDFYTMVIVLGFFGIEFIYKMAIVIIKEIKDGR